MTMKGGEVFEKQIFALTRLVTSSSVLMPLLTSTRMDIQK